MGDYSPTDIEFLVSRVEQAGSALGERATRLSQLIEDVTRRLCEIEGKVPVQVSNGDVVLSFDRGQHNWGIWLTDDDCDQTPNGPIPEYMSSVSVARKTAAFPLLPKLLFEIELLQTTQIAAIDEAFKRASEDANPSAKTAKRGDN